MRGRVQPVQLDVEKRIEQTWELKPKTEPLLVATDRPVAIKALVRCLEVSEEEVSTVPAFR
jgi:hypothetical protein